MYVELTEEQNMLRDSIERYLRDNYSFDHRQAVVKSSDSFSAEMWSTFAELGWLAMCFSEEAGGFGGGAIETALMCEEFGKYLVLEPYIENVVFAGDLLARSDNEQGLSMLEGIMAGETQLATAFLEDGHVADFKHVATTATLNADRYCLNGAKTMVMNAPAADYLIVSARTSGDINSASGISLFLIDKQTAGVSLAGFKTYDGRGAATLTLDQVELPVSALLGELDKGAELLQQAQDKAAFAVSAEAVGAMTTLLNATVEYTKQRTQFGQPIANFQALRHRMADMYIQMELCRSLMWACAWKMDNQSHDVEHVLAALKAKVDSTARFVAQSAIQLHGGIGVTDELSIGHYFKRVAAISSQFGGRNAHLNKFLQTLNIEI